MWGKFLTLNEYTKPESDFFVYQKSLKSVFDFGREIHKGYFVINKLVLNASFKAFWYIKVPNYYLIIGLKKL